MKRVYPGAELDGFRIGELLHKGGMALIYRVTWADARTAPFDMVMKLPRMAAQDGAENLVGFEVEHQIMQAVNGPHVPRLVAAGDMAVLPYLVMEYVHGRTLDHWLEQVHQGQACSPVTLAALGAAVATAAHALHQQNAVHLDLKMGNVIIQDPASSDRDTAVPVAGNGANKNAASHFYAVLIDFGLSYHAHYPDLLAEEMRKAVGSPAYMAPEQVVGVRGDPRSDVFSIGVILYELATGELPFGSPSTTGGLRQRLWVDPVPPASDARTCPSGCRK